jgi:hypothetical protein
MAQLIDVPIESLRDVSFSLFVWFFSY